MKKSVIPTETKDQSQDLTRAEILKRLTAAKNEAEWNSICDEAKKAGGYPDWWFQEVIVSGLAGSKQIEFAVWK